MTEPDVRTYGIPHYPKLAQTKSGRQTRNISISQGNVNLLSKFEDKARPMTTAADQMSEPSIENSEEDITLEKS